MQHSLSYRWIILGCCVLAYSSSYLIRWSYTGLAPFIREDLQLDKAALGVLGAAFFYPYALAQILWGTITDRWGGRLVIALGVLASALGLALFATSHDFQEALIWRMVVGIVAASAFVPIASLLGQWFSSQERGMANGVYYGLGGGLGEGTAFLVLPLLYIYFLQDTGSLLSGWRGATLVMSLGLILIGMLCWALIQSYPTPTPIQIPSSPPTPLSSTPQIHHTDHPRWFQDPVLWMLGGYFAAGIIALRLVPGWITIFASDLYHHNFGYETHEAIVAGGTIGIIYTIGHIVGSPLLGKLSDNWTHQVEHRCLLAGGVLGTGAVSLFVLTLPIINQWILGGIAFLLGVSLHAFPIINAAVADRWGVGDTGKSLGVINMVGQLAGAIALTASGYIAMALSKEAGNPIDEYLGIWYLGALSCALGALCGWGAYRGIRPT
jgi:sugar phosphate permease